MHLSASSSILGTLYQHSKSLKLWRIGRVFPSDTEFRDPDLSKQVGNSEEDAISLRELI